MTLLFKKYYLMLYKGDFVNGKRTKHPIYYENVVEPIVSKEKWDNFQSQNGKQLFKDFFKKFKEICDSI